MRLAQRARRRLAGEAGFTLVELLVATAMGVVLMGGVSVLLIGALRSQPELSKRAQNIATARWVLERLTREIRNGVNVSEATASRVSLRTYVRHSTCGGSATLASNLPATLCQVAYSCTTSSCSRTETAPGVLSGGTAVPIFRGINESNVFCYVPSKNADPTICGPAPADLSTVTYIGLRLHIPNPKGTAALTVSDGASLRNAILSQ